MTRRGNRARRGVLLGALAACGALVSTAGAQGAVPMPVAPAKPARRAQAAAAADTTPKPPLSPRRALLLSLLLPGYAQSRLQRQTSSMLFTTAEVLAIGMARKSALDLRAAKNAVGDSVPSAYTIDSTGTATPTGPFIPGPINRDRVNARRTHYEDWIAAILFNHLLSGLDAYIAANLWDFNANIDPSTRTATVSKRIPF